jgi:hypothetical protein
VARDKEARFQNEELSEIASQVLFNKTRYSGVALARRLGVNQNTLWVRFNRKGISLQEARGTADAMVEWAHDMLETSMRLRALAEEELGVPAEPFEVRKYRKRRAKEEIEASKAEQAESAPPPPPQAAPQEERGEPDPSRPDQREDQRFRITAFSYG